MEDSRKLYRSGDPETSKLAAEAVNITKRQQQALDWFRYVGRPMTGAELSELSGIPGLWKRVNELEAMGLIVKTGRRVRNPGGGIADQYWSTEKGKTHV